MLDTIGLFGQKCCAASTSHALIADVPAAVAVQPGHEGAGRPRGGRHRQEGGGDRGGNQDSGDAAQGGQGDEMMIDSHSNDGDDGDASSPVRRWRRSPAWREPSSSCS